MGRLEVGTEGYPGEGPRKITEIRKHCVNTSAVSLGCYQRSPLSKFDKFS